MKDLAFAPVSRLHRAVVSARNWLYDREVFPSHASELPVVCVGNAVMGGSGKSPMTQYIGRNLSKRGWRPVVVLRGYRGSFRGVVEVCADSRPEEVGDEAVMHAQLFGGDCRVIVSRDRVAACNFISEFDLGDIVLLDDGYQHRRLKRDVNILLLPQQSGQSVIEAIRHARMFPQGMLREPYEAALRRADIGVSILRNTSERMNFPEIGTLSIFGSTICHVAFETKFCGWRDVRTGEVLKSTELPSGAITALCGIAHPGQFFLMLENEKIITARQLAFRDHMQYSERKIRRAVRDADVVLTTEKDAVKLQRISSLQAPVFAASFQVEPIMERDEDRFWNLLDSKLSQFVASPYSTCSSDSAD